MAECVLLVVYTNLYQERARRVVERALACLDTEETEEEEEDEEEITVQDHPSEHEMISIMGVRPSGLQCRGEPPKFSDPVEASRIIETLKHSNNHKFWSDTSFKDVWPYVTALYINDGFSTNILGEKVLLDSDLTKALNGVSGIAFREDLADFDVMRCPWCHIFGYINHRIVTVGKQSVVILNIDSESG